MLLIEVPTDSDARVEVPTDSRVLLLDPAVDVLAEEMPTMDPPVLLIGVAEEAVEGTLVEAPSCCSWATPPPERPATSPAGLVGNPCQMSNVWERTEGN